MSSSESNFIEYCNKAFKQNKLELIYLEMMNNINSIKNVDKTIIDEVVSEINFRKYPEYHYHIMVIIIASNHSSIFNLRDMLYLTNADFMSVELYIKLLNIFIKYCNKKFIEIKYNHELFHEEVIKKQCLFYKKWIKEKKTINNVQDIEEIYDCETSANFYELLNNTPIFYETKMKLLSDVKNHQILTYAPFIIDIIIQKLKGHFPEHLNLRYAYNNRQRLYNFPEGMSLIISNIKIAVAVNNINVYFPLIIDSYTHEYMMHMTTIYNRFTYENYETFYYDKKTPENIQSLVQSNMMITLTSYRNAAIEHATKYLQNIVAKDILPIICAYIMF